MADRVVDEQNPDNHLSSKEIHTLIRDDERDPVEVMDFSHLASGPSPFDPVLTDVLLEVGGLLTATPFAHESLLVDRAEKRLSKAEKRLAERSYAMERTSQISYSRPSYAAFYPSAGTSATNLNTPGSTGLSRQRYDTTNTYPTTTNEKPLNVKRPAVAAPRLPAMPTAQAPQFNSLQWLAESNGGSGNNRPVASVRPQPCRSPVNIQEDGPAGPVPISNILKTTCTDPGSANGKPQPVPTNGNSFLDPRNRVVANLPNVGVGTEYKPAAPAGGGGGKAFPMEALAKKKGVSINEWTVPSDMLIPTREDGQSPVTLRAGQRVHLIKTPKGMYLKMGDNIIKIRIPEALLAATMGVSPAVGQIGQPRPSPNGPSEVVTLSDSSSSSEECSNGGTESGPRGRPLPGSAGSSQPQSSSSNSSSPALVGSGSPS